jgi:hypothetical protein
MILLFIFSSLINDMLTLRFDIQPYGGFKQRGIEDYGLNYI